MKMMGEFRGIKKAKIEEPELREEGEYDTVHHGKLTYFSLIVPENAEVKEERVCEGVKIITIKSNGKVWRYRVSYGDAWWPDSVRELR